MKRYWDHSEEERARLTEEEVKDLLAYELMEKGVLRVEAPKFEAVSAVEIPKTPVFTLSEATGYGSDLPLGIGFDTLEQAEACRGAIRYIREAQWNEPARIRAPRALQIIAENLPSTRDFAARKALLDENTRRERVNAEAQKEYEAACKMVSDATSDVWSDWFACQKAEARHEKIRRTLAEYRLMTGGDETMARRFLDKAFPREDILAAVGEMLPTPAEGAL